MSIGNALDALLMAMTCNQLDDLSRRVADEKQRERGLNTSELRDRATWAGVHFRLAAAYLDEIADAITAANGQAASDAISASIRAKLNRPDSSLTFDSTPFPPNPEEES